MYLLHRCTWPITNHSKNAQHIVFPRLNFVFSCFIYFRCVTIVLILHFLCDSTGQHIIWFVISCYLQRQQLSQDWIFYFCRVIVVVSREKDIFTSMTSILILFNYRFRYVHAIKCTILLVYFFIIVGIVCTLVLCVPWWVDVMNYLLLFPFDWVSSWPYTCWNGVATLLVFFVNYICLVV